MRPVCRLGDFGSHGGIIVTASEDVIVNDRGVARQGDVFMCPVHGPQVIVTASPDVIANDRGVARVGDVTSCGAVLLTGSGDTSAN